MKRVVGSSPAGRRLRDPSPVHKTTPRPKPIPSITSHARTSATSTLWHRPTTGPDPRSIPVPAIQAPSQNQHQIVPAPERSNNIVENPFMQDRLGTLVTKMSSLLSNCTSWEEFVHQARGKPYLASHIDQIPHPARELLQDFRDQGVPVPLAGAPWTRDKIMSCIERGPHPSADQHKLFARDAFADFVQKGFWVGERKS